MSVVGASAWRMSFFRSAEVPKHAELGRATRAGATIGEVPVRALASPRRRAVRERDRRRVCGEKALAFAMNRARTRQRSRDNAHGVPRLFRGWPFRRSALRDHDAKDRSNAALCQCDSFDNSCRNSPTMLRRRRRPAQTQRGGCGVRTTCGTRFSCWTGLRDARWSPRRNRSFGA